MRTGSAGCAPRRPARGSGLGRQLMHAVLAEVGDRACVLDAQAHLEDFYREFGFEPTGPVHDEDGIPHVAMRREGTRGRAPR